MFISLIININYQDTVKLYMNTPQFLEEIKA
jgi:hypothetical protein